METNEVSEQFYRLEVERRHRVFPRRLVRTAPELEFTLPGERTSAHRTAERQEYEVPKRRSQFNRLDRKRELAQSLTRLSNEPCLDPLAPFQGWIGCLIAHGV